MSPLISMPFYADLYRSVPDSAGSSTLSRWPESATVRTNSDRANGCRIVRGVPARHSLAIDPALLGGQFGRWARGNCHQRAAEGVLFLMGSHGSLMGRQSPREWSSVCVPVSPPGCGSCWIVSSSVGQCCRVLGMGWHDPTLIGTRWYRVAWCAPRVRWVSSGYVACQAVPSSAVSSVCALSPSVAGVFAAGAASAWWWLLAWRRVWGFGGVHCGADVGGAQSVADLGCHVGCGRVV